MVMVWAIKTTNALTRNLRRVTNLIQSIASIYSIWRRKKEMKWNYIIIMRTQTDIQLQPWRNKNE